MAVLKTRNSSNLAELLKSLAVGVAMAKNNSQEEYQMIQDTLSMTPEERLELIAALIVDKILEDQHNSEELLTQILEEQHG